MSSETGLGAPLAFIIAKVRVRGLKSRHEPAPGGAGQLVGGMLGRLGEAANTAAQICIAMVKRHRGSLSRKEGLDNGENPRVFGGGMVAQGELERTSIAVVELS